MAQDQKLREHPVLDAQQDAAAAPPANDPAADEAAIRREEEHLFPLGNELTYFLHVG